MKTDPVLPVGLEALLAKWRELAEQSELDGDLCCAITREHDADELEAVLSAEPRQQEPTERMLRFILDTLSNIANNTISPRKYTAPVYAREILDICATDFGSVHARDLLKVEATEPRQQEVSNEEVSIVPETNDGARSVLPQVPEGILASERQIAPSDDEVIDFLVAYYGFPSRTVMETFHSWASDIRDEVKLIQSWATLKSADETATLRKVALAFHRDIEGEYGCPGESCPGVQRLIAKLTAMQGVGRYDYHEIPEAPEPRPPAAAPSASRRYFTNVTGFEDSTAYVYLDEQGRCFAVNRDGHEWLYTAARLDRWLELVKEGKWRELRLDEAQALIARPPVAAVDRELGFVIEKYINALAAPREDK